MGGVKPRSLAASFVLLALAVAAPLTLLNIIAAEWYVQSEHARLTETARSTGRSVVERLDRDLAELGAIARTLASSPLLDEIGLSGFEAQARQIRTVKNATIVLSELDGRQRVNTRAEPGRALPTVPRPEIVAALLAKREAVVSDVMIGGINGRKIVGVSAPVIRNGVVVRMVSANMPIEAVETLVTNAGIATPYFATIRDGRGRVIAQAPPPSSTQAEEPGSEDVVFVDRSGLSGWTVMSGLDREALEAPLWRSVNLLATFGMILLTGGGLIAWLTMRAVFTQIGHLTAAAAAIGSGRPVAFVPSAIREADVIGRALAAASGTLIEQRAAIEAAQCDLEARVAERSRELEASRAHYRVLADNVGDMIVMRPLGSHAISYVSPSSATMFGLDPDDVRFDRIGDGIHPADLPAVIAIDTALAAGQDKVTCLFRARRQDGRWIWVESVSTRVGEPGVQDAQVVSVLRDVTLRQTQAEELRIARDVAELAQAKAESANRAKSEVLEAVSREVRNPLSTIKGLAEFLAEIEEPGAEQRRYATLIGEASAGLLRAVDDMLDVAKVETGDLRIESAPFVLSHAVGQALETAGKLAARHAMALGAERDAVLAGAVLGDERRVRQVILSLAMTALNHRRDGHLTVSAARRRRGTEAERLDFVVSAQGRPVPAEDRGFGESVARRLIEMMGGSLLRHEEEDGRFAYAFSLHLPPCGALEAPAALGEAHRPSARILVAEDHPVNQDILRRMLEQAGHSVDIVADGQEAVAAVQVAPYDLVVMDILMPVLDGLSATRQIRALPHPCRHIPIVAITANVTPEQVRCYREAGMDDHVPKPLERQRLCAAIDGLLASVRVVIGPTETDEPAPGIFDRAAYDGLVASFGAARARAMLDGFVALLDAGPSEPSSVAVGARRLGFLDLAAAHEHLAEAEPEAREAALVRCRIARELVQRVLGELTEQADRGADRRVALL